MNSDRIILTDEMWNRIEGELPGKASDPGVTAADNRLFLEAVLYRARTGTPWRDLPSYFGNWNSVFKRFRRWVNSGVFDRIFGTLSDEFDLEYVMIDGTIVRAHQKASGGEGGAESQGLGRSKGGLTTKIVALVDALGYLVTLVILPGQRHDIVGVPPLLEDLDFEALIGDKAFDADWLLKEIRERGAIPVIPARSNRTVSREIDQTMYGWRHQVENFFAKLKEYRAIATRYCKTATSFRATVLLAAAVIAGK